MPMPWPKLAAADPSWEFGAPAGVLGSCWTGKCHRSLLLHLSARLSCCRFNGCLGLAREWRLAREVCSSPVLSRSRAMSARASQVSRFLWPSLSACPAATVSESCVNPIATYFGHSAPQCLQDALKNLVGILELSAVEDVTMLQRYENLLCHPQKVYICSELLSRPLASNLRPHRHSLVETMDTGGYCCRVICVMPAVFHHVCSGIWAVPPISDSSIVYTLRRSARLLDIGLKLSIDFASHASLCTKQHRALFLTTCSILTHGISSSVNDIVRK
ncbi:hypothetical protein MRB53_039904 [Persea americana]|nr:hypothetical protein MRB53_039904 [Persea americana]